MDRRHGSGVLLQRTADNGPLTNRNHSCSIDQGNIDAATRTTPSRALRLLVVRLSRSSRGASRAARPSCSATILAVPPGWLTRPVGQLNGAIQEYHYLPHRGVPLGPWANAICHLDAWAVGEEDGTPYLEQHTVNDQCRADEPASSSPATPSGRITRSRSRCSPSRSTTWPASSSATTPIATTTCSR